MFTKVLGLLNGTETAGDINITGVLGISGLIGHLPFLKKNGLPLVMRMRFMVKIAVALMGHSDRLAAPARWRSLVLRLALYSLDLVARCYCSNQP